jgi:hypothetical protein
MAMLLLQLTTADAAACADFAAQPTATPHHALLEGRQLLLQPLHRLGEPAYDSTSGRQQQANVSFH